MTDRCRLTDDAIDDLPLHHGRVDLLEELIRTPVHDAAPTRAPRRTHPRTVTWAAPLAAAAVVAALATAPLWTGATGPGTGREATGAAAAASDDAAYRIVLDAPGWKVDHADSGGLGIAYTSGDARVEIGSRPASLYGEYVADRRRITDPPTDGSAVEVLGRPARMWAYNRHDHTVIREAEHDLSYEIRGQGLSEADFRDLLGRLRLVDQDGFEATLPARFVTTAERPAAIADLLDGIAGTLAPGQAMTPSGAARPRVDSQSSDPYELGIDVAKAVACPWLDVYADARAAGDTARATRAADLLATSARWPVALELDTEGDWPDVLWQYADDAAAGRDVDGFAGGLGCS